MAYWCESIESKNRTLAFYAKKRLSNDDDDNNLIAKFEADVVLMGIDCPPSANGSYYLTTDSNSPYSRGMNGIDGT